MNKRILGILKIFFSFLEFRFPQQLNTKLNTLI